MERPLGAPASTLKTLWTRWANGALVRAMTPLLSTVAIAIGVLWKKRVKRTSAVRCGSVPSSLARLRTSVRDAPGVASAANATLWWRRTGGVRPSRRGQVEIEDLGLDLARMGDAWQRRAVAGHVGEPQPPDPTWARP
jgi:hypothetical protein